MAHVIIDRRKTDKGKSTVNRRKFINRVKDLLKEGVKDIIRDNNMKDLVGDNGKKVKIPVRNLDEPHFRHDGSGINDIVRPGNDQFKPGDKIKRPEDGDGQGNKGSQDGEGEDSFTFHLTKDEFLDLFFENCALPDMVKRNLALVNEEVIQRSGFTSDGSPSSLNIMRSMRGAKSRRSGLRALKNKKLKELEAKEAELVEEIECLTNNKLDTSVEQDALDRVRAEIEVVKRRIKAIPFIDPLDLKFNNWNKVQIPSVQAVVFCVMDVSGSMDERKKELAKTFYLLLYLFLQQNYQRIEIVYVTYHTRAAEVDEHTFYYGQESGGTVTSTGLQHAADIIAERYPTEMWNIYLAHASDGDNYDEDNVLVEDLLRNKLLPVLQYYAYVQINPEHDHYRMGEGGLWGVISKIAETNSHASAVRIASEEQVYPVFLKLFERKK